MKNNMKILVALMLTLSIGFMACSKEETGKSDLRIRLTDAPTELDSVFVDIKEVRVKMGDDVADTLTEDGWVNLETHAAIYNLLGLQNGVDTLLANGLVNTGYVKEIRLVLGSNNRVVDSMGVSHPLTIPSGSESGLKIKVNKKLNATLETLLIDFDTDLSIKKEMTGYKLRPVIKLK